MCRHWLYIEQRDGTFLFLSQNCMQPRGLFGEQCSAARVWEEMAGYSDFQLHRFSLQHPRRFGEYALDAARVMDSGKCAALARLLPQLKVCRLHSAVLLIT